MEDMRGREDCNSSGWRTPIHFSGGCYFSVELPVGLLSEFSSSEAGPV